ncbi:MAG: histidine kinase [Coriobacteriales bacterium]|nr:histidine kinase [Coriobacteriales bacterium]
MRSFFAAAAQVRQHGHSGDESFATSSSPSARIALYDGSAAAPRIIDVVSPSFGEFIEEASTLVYRYAREAGGSLPYTVIRELVENLIHSGLREPVVSILDAGDTIRFADQGPGIRDKTRALLPGFTTATAEMKQHIRGVGSGLPIVGEFLSVSGGTLEIDDNLGGGCVVTISLAARGTNGPPRTGAEGEPVRARPEESAQPDLFPSGSPFRMPARLSARQKRVLALVMETGAAGPSLVARELSIAVSTAHRDLAHLEGMGLIESDDEGKRGLTDRGIAAADELLR